jgi:hypothetical protein
VRISKNISLLVLSFVLAGAGLVVNSCKKDNQGTSLKTLLTGNWQLASLRVDNFSGDSVKRDTLNTNCDTTQTFKFDGSGKCSYSSYSCLKKETATGNWTLSDDQLVLHSDIECKDTSKVGKVKPFTDANIINLGENSLVLEVNKTIDTIRKSPLVLRRSVTRYGFIRQMSR